jgi:type VI secretion system protein ImpA
MNERVTKLLQPVSAEQPCGPDLSSDPRFDELQTLLKGTPEVEIGSIQRPAEPPDWRELADKSAAFLAHSKHLGVATMWCCSVLKVEGLPGFRDGLQLLGGLLEQHWAAVHPLLDPEDDNDPTQRLNILGALTAPRASGRGGWLTFVDYLYAAPIFQPRGASPVAFEALLAVDAPEAANTAAAAIHAAPAKQIAEQCQALAEALEAVKGIDQSLTTTLGAGNTISFEVLQNTLNAMHKALAPSVPGCAAVSEDAGTSVESAEPAGAVAVRGPIRTRADVVRQLESICAYYEQMEPSSPVPYLLRRARTLVNMNFLQAVQELNFAPLESLRPTMGSVVDSLTPSPAPAPEVPAAQA